MLVLVLLSWSWSWTPTQTRTQTRIQTRTLNRTQTRTKTDPDSWTGSGGLCRYGNSLECCWGWRPTDGGRCQPSCQQGCKHGVCVQPDVCECLPGYTGKACNHDLNECGLKPRPCQHRCINTPGSFKCFCPDGFWTDLEGGGCRSSRTCYHGNCQYGCEVVKGVVLCTCPSPGLRLGPDRRTCVDVDECVSGGGKCPRRRKCVNTFGSFFCKCHLGFRLVFVDGSYACIDKDSRTFCSINPSSPKCRCGDGGCHVVPRVTVEPPRPRTAAATTAAIPTATPGTSGTTVTATMATTRTAAMATTLPAPPSDAATTTTSTSPVPTTTAAPSTTMSTTTMSTTTMSTTTMSTTTMSTTTMSSTAPTAPPPTTTAGTLPAVAVTTVATPTTSTVTTTIDNRINKEVTQKQRGDVHIPRQSGHNQVWDFDIELGNTAEDVGDDPEVETLRCSFDGGLCDWMSDGDGDLPWEVVRRPAGGAYLSVPELRAGQRSLRGARLAIRVPPSWSHAPLCLDFSHWLPGHHVGVLQLFVKAKGRGQRYGSALWSRTGGRGWRHAQLTIASRSVDAVLLKAERRKEHGGPIAVDAVILMQGACR